MYFISKRETNVQNPLEMLKMKSKVEESKKRRNSYRGIQIRAMKKGNWLTTM